LRFIAASMIVVFHSRGLFGISYVWDSLGQGVSFFFVLSGFILTYVYPSLSGAREVGRFLTARVARIWPAHVTAFLLLLWLLPSGSRTLDVSHPMLAAVANVLMVHSWLPYPGYFFSYNAPSWSISTECFFYLFFPLLVWRWSRNWQWKLAFAAGVLVGTIVLCNFLALPTAAPPFPPKITASALIYINPIGRLFEFVLGMCVALYWSRHQTAKLSKLTASLAELGCIALIVLGLFLLRNAAATRPLLGTAGSEYMLHSGCGILFAIFICLMAWGRGFVSRILSYAVPVLLGEISYSIYLIHQVLLRYYSAIQLQGKLPNWVTYAIFWCTLLAGSWLIWLLIEKPSRRAIVHWWDRNAERRAARVVASDEQLSSTGRRVLPETGRV